MEIGDEECRGEAPWPVQEQLSPGVRRSAQLAIALALFAPGLARPVGYLFSLQFLGGNPGMRNRLNPDSPRQLSRVVTLAGLAT